MSVEKYRRLYDHVVRYDTAAWQQALDALASGIHDVDRNATRIWHAFFPLDLHLALEAADDRAALARKLGLMGKWRLADQVDSSHTFLFGHRYWPQIRTAMAGLDTLADGLPAIVTAVADAAARTARVDREKLVGIAFAGLMTLRQAGPDAFAAASGQIHISAEAERRSLKQVLDPRRRNESQGPFGFLRGLKKRWTVTFDENDPTARFELIAGQDMASAAQSDRRDHRSRDARCIVNEGPIPVECRAASCGTCWVGVLNGAEKLSPIVERDEGRRLKVFGYIDPASTDPQPLIRLACQARPAGTVSVVIPPWNGIWGSARKSG